MHDEQPARLLERQDRVLEEVLHGLHRVGRGDPRQQLRRALVGRAERELHDRGRERDDQRHPQQRRPGERRQPDEDVLRSRRRSRWPTASKYTGRSVSARN